MQEQWLLGRRLWLLGGDAVKDRLGIDRRLMPDRPLTLGLALEKLARCGRAMLYLINGRRDEVPLAYGVQET